MRETLIQRARRFQAENLDSARRILADPGRYGGEGSGLHQWAALVVARHTPEADRQGRLFPEAVANER